MISRNDSALGLFNGDIGLRLTAAAARLVPDAGRERSLSSPAVCPSMKPHGDDGTQKSQALSLTTRR